MDKKEIDDYIKRLESIEKELMSDDPELSVIGDLNKLLSSLDTEVSTEINFVPLEIKIKKLNPTATIPTYAKLGDAGMDLTITSIISETTTDVSYGFGIALEIPNGYIGLFFPRSSIRKYDLTLTNCVGVIDSGYRGELQATFKKTNWLKGDSSEKYNVGDKCAQIIIIPYPQVKFTEVNELSSSERSVGGFGSTGK